MSTRPRTPAPGTPAPGKLPITELAELKTRRQPIVMVTAYDHPSARLADGGRRRPDPRRRLGGNDVLGHDLDRAGDDGRDGHADARRDAGAPPAVRRRRHAVRLVPGLGRRRGRERRSASSRSPAPTRSSSRAPARCCRASRHRRRGHPRDGPPRPDAAVGDDAGRLQGAGPDGGEGRPAPRRRARARGRRLLLDRARGGPRAGRERRSPRRSRSRRSASAPVRAPTDRFSSGTTCSASTRASAPVREALRRPRPAIRDAVSAYAADVRERRFPEDVHTYAISEEELEAFRVSVGAEDTLQARRTS